jgi:hypothetical protein
MLNRALQLETLLEVIRKILKQMTVHALIILESCLKDKKLKIKRRWKIYKFRWTGEI